MLVCEKLGVKSSLEELARLSGKDERGTSLSGLCVAAGKMNLQAVGMKIGLDGLSRLKTPAIAHLWNNHFVVVESGGPEGIRITEPIEPPQGMAFEDFKLWYSGHALVVSKDKGRFPEPISEGPDVRFDEYICDLGYCDEGQILRRTIGYRNVGNKNLVIYSLRPSCSCTRAELSEYTVSRGGQGELSIYLDTTGLHGDYSTEVYVDSNDPVSPTVQIKLGCHIKPSRVPLSMRAVNFGNVRAGECTTREVRILDPGDGMLKIAEPITKSTHVSAQLEELAGKSHHQYLVRLKLSPDTPVGRFHSEVVIYTNYPRERRIVLPITARVRGGVELYPGILFFGLLKKGEKAEKSIRVVGTTDTPLIIRGVDTPFPFLTTAVSREGAKNQQWVTATLDVTAPPGAVRGTMVIHTNDARDAEIKIPVYAIVRDE